MKTTMLSTIILLTFSLFILIPQTVAENFLTFLYPQSTAEDLATFSLPEGAVARLGKGWINEIEYSPDGSLLAVASTVGIWLYDAETGAEKALLTGHTESVTSVSFNSDGTMLVSGSWDHTVRLWDVTTGMLKATLTGHEGTVNSVDFSPDDTMVASGSNDNAVRLWDVASETRKATLWHTENVNSVKFRPPDGATLASVGDDNRVRLWDIETLTQKATLNLRYDGYSISFSPDGNTLASGANGGYAGLWDVGTGTLITWLDPERGQNKVSRVGFSRDGKTLACSSPDGTLRLWDVATRTEKATLMGGSSNANYIINVSFNQDSTTLASANWSAVALWDVLARDVKKTLPRHNAESQSVRFSPDGSLLVNSDPGMGAVHLWDVATRTRKAVFPHGEELWRTFFNSDSTTIASQTWGGLLVLYDVDTESFIGVFSDVYGASFSPDGTKLATGHNGNVQLWDLTTMSEIITFASPSYNLTLRFSSDGTMMASGSTDGSVRLWDLTTLERKAEFWHYSNYDVYGISFNSDDTILASASEDDTVQLWDLTTLKGKATLEHSYNVGSVDFSPDGKTLVSVRRDSKGFDNWLHLWDATTGTYKTSLEHSSDINAYAFSPDGSTLVSGSDDNTVQLWDVVTGTHKATLTGHNGDVNSVQFSPDGDTLVSGSDDGSVLFWEISSVRTVGISPSIVESAAIGEQFTVQVNITAGSNVGGYQATVEYDSTALRYVESANGDYLPEGSFFLKPIVDENSVQVAGTSLTSASQKTFGSLATLTFEVVTIKESVLKLSNVIVTDIDGEHLPHFTVSGRVIKPQPRASSAIVRVTPAVVNSPEVGETIVFNAEIIGGENISSYDLVWHYDESALEFVSSNKGRYIPTGGFSKGIGNGDGTLETATFRVKAIKSSTVRVSGFLTAPNGLISVPTFESAQVNAFVFGDVNRDGVVDIRDLVLVATNFGNPVPEEGHPADVNADGLINIVDLVKVAGALRDGDSAPTLLTHASEFNLTKAEVQKWLTEAQQLQLTDPTSLRGIHFLEQLLEALTPKETALLHNYPNPFNPETWIPYQLAQPTDVTVTIYAADGTLVRKLDLGHQPIGMYQSRNRAAHWDGKNAVGEAVASGVYYYTLIAGDFSATRKMLILK
ncbi:T9SS type A sorting domain-containing protein [Candidatus Poribacteria bacterium]|nr:T9SS type A sorting domain-containing protein [Candidatus Poribacteria bacterium]